MGPTSFAQLLVAALLAGRSPDALQVTVLGDAADPRAAAITEAIAYWNERLAIAGARIRFGDIQFSKEVIPDEWLRDVSAGGGRGGSSRSAWSQIRTIPGDVIIVMSGADLVSTGFEWHHGGKGLVVLRRGDSYPFSLPNVPRNAVAHELGHVLGLPHDSDSSSLMCGRPAPCRPDMFRSDTPHFFPLTPEAERQLRESWS